MCEPAGRALRRARRAGAPRAAAARFFLPLACTRWRAPPYRHSVSPREADMGARGSAFFRPDQRHSVVALRQKTQRTGFIELMVQI